MRPHPRITARHPHDNHRVARQASASPHDRHPVRTTSVRNVPVLPSRATVPTLRPLTRSLLAAMLLYALWARDMCREVLTRLDRALPSDIADPLLNAIILDWNSRHLPLTEAWWHFPMFAPLAGVTTFTEHLLAVSLVATPIIWITGSPITAYNLVYAGSFVFAAGAMFALAWSLTGDPWASAIAGFAFGFPLYSNMQVSHIQMLMTGWMPIALLGLHRYMETGRARWLPLVGAAWLAAALSNGYFLVFFGVLLALWLAWFGLRPGRVGRLAAVVATLAIASLPLAPILLHYARVHAAYGFSRLGGEIDVYSADVTALLHGHPRLSLWGRAFAPIASEVLLFPGLTLPALAAAGWWWALTGRLKPAPTYDGVRAAATNDDGRGGRLQPARTADAARRAPWPWRHALLGIAALLVLVALVVWRVGGWRGIVLGVRISVSRPENTMSIALAFLLAWVATSPRARAAWRRADAGVFYAWAALITWLFTLGAHPRLNGVPVLGHAPYQWLVALPGGDALRVPGRFWVMTLICLAALAALGVQALRTRVGGARAWAIPAALLAALAAESHYRINAEPLPMGAADTDVRTADAMVLEFPMGDYRDLLAVYRAERGGYRTVNGYSGYYPPFYTPLGYGLAYFRDGLLDPLRERGPVLAVIRPDARSSPEVLAYLTSQPGAGAAVTGAVSTLVLLPAMPPAPAPPLGARLTPAAVVVSNEAQRMPLLFDGRLDTAWDPGIQRRDDELVVNLGRPRAIGTVVLAMGRFAANFPRRLEVAISNDGERWETTWAGPAEARIVRAALANPVRVPLSFTFDGREARYIRFRQTGRHPEYSWSIAELEVYAPW